MVRRSCEKQIWRCLATRNVICKKYLSISRLRGERPSLGVYRLWYRGLIWVASSRHWGSVHFLRYATMATLEDDA